MFSQKNRTAILSVTLLIGFIWSISGSFGQTSNDSGTLISQAGNSNQSYDALIVVGSTAAASDYAVAQNLVANISMSLAGDGLSNSGTNPRWKIINDTDFNINMTAKHIFVIGGTCVNKLTAALLQVEWPLCGQDFTAISGIGSGNFIVATALLDNSTLATIVAGYEAQDTTTAGQYISSGVLNLTAGSHYESAASVTNITSSTP